MAAGGIAGSDTGQKVENIADAAKAPLDVAAAVQPEVGVPARAADTALHAVGKGMDTCAAGMPRCGEGFPNLSYRYHNAGRERLKPRHTLSPAM